MPVATTIKDYDIHVYWDNRAEYFVAEIPEIYTCAADGATQSEAVQFGKKAAPWNGCPCDS
jgi:predicted RNase H-like HicB family nuclease